MRFDTYAALGFSMLLHAAAAASPPTGIPDGWSNGYVYANGIRIHYYQAVPAPDKPVIVMLHGITDNGLCWTTLAWELQGDFNVYMVDTRGHGLSDPFTASDDGDTLVRDAVAFVEAMEFDKPILVGHSMGAATLMRLGAEYPDVAGAIVMLDPPGLRDPGPDRDEREARDPAAWESQRAPAPPPRESSRPPQAQQAPPEPAKDRLPVTMAGPPEALVAQNNSSFEDLVATCRRQNPKWDLVDCQYWALSKKQYHGAYSDQAWRVMSGVMRVGDSLANIPVPALVLKADAPPEVRERHLEVAAGMRNGTLVHIDGAGHNLHHDELERTVELLEEFLSALE